MPTTANNDHEKMGSMQPDSQPLVIKGASVTLERLNASHIPLLFAGLGFPENNRIVDWITGFPYVYSEDELSNYLFGYMHNNPDLTIYAIKACQSHLGPPGLPEPRSHTSVLGIVGYRLSPKSRTIKLDDFLFSPMLQRTYASTEVMYLIHLHLFEGQALPYCRVSMTCNTLNVKCMRTMERTGYKYEGTLRKNNVTRWGTSRDSACLSMLDVEWPLNKRVLETWLLATNFAADGRQIRSVQNVRDQQQQAKCLL